MKSSRKDIDFSVLFERYFNSYKKIW